MSSKKIKFNPMSYYKEVRHTVVLGKTRGAMSSIGFLDKKKKKS